MQTKQRTIPKRGVGAELAEKDETCFLLLEERKRERGRHGVYCAASAVRVCVSGGISVSWGFSGGPGGNMRCLENHGVRCRPVVASYLIK